MFVPCDIPLVKAQDFNALIGQTLNNDADYFPAVIRTSCLRKTMRGVVSVKYTSTNWVTITRFSR